MKRLLALLAGGLGLRALLKRRSRPALQPSPAEDLRAKLAQTKSQETPTKSQETPTKSHETQTQSHETPTQEPQTKEPEPEPEPERAQPETVEERRADVHSKARQAIDDLGQS